MKGFNPTVTDPKTVVEKVDQLPDTNVLKQALNGHSAVNVAQLPETNLLKQHLDKEPGVRHKDMPETQLPPVAVQAAKLSDIALARKPENLNRRLNDQLRQNGINAKKWDKAKAAERLAMTNQMFDIMMSEMQIPQNIRSKVKLWYYGSDAPSAAQKTFSNRYASIFKPDPQGTLVIKDNPRINLHYGLLYGDYETALGTLYNQAVYVMQQATCVEPAGTFHNPVEQAKWSAEVQKMVRDGNTATNDMISFATEAEKQMLNYLKPPHCANISFTNSGRYKK